MGFDKYIMTCTSHESIVLSSFTALKMLCASLVHPSLLPFEPLETIDLFLFP